MAEITRRHPTIRVIETHPGGGQYDCLHLLLKGQGDHDRPGIVLNRHGSLHILADTPGDDVLWETFWSDYLAADDPRLLLDQLCDRARLPRVRRLPRSTPATVGYRFIAAFLSSTVFGRVHWECRNGFFDSSDAECAVTESFAAFPAARARLLDIRLDDILGQPAYRFWFLGDSEPKLCLETTGLAWDAEGNEFDLAALYRARRRLWPVVNFVARDLLF